MATGKNNIVALVASAASLAHSAKIEQYLREGRPVSGGSTGNAAIPSEEAVVSQTLFPESIITELIESVPWDSIPDKSMVNGKPMKTTKVQSFTLVQEGFRYQFSGSINRYPQPVASGAKGATRNLARAVDKFDVTPEQEAALDPEALAAVNTLKKLRDAGKI